MKGRLEEVIERLRQGKVGIFPTDTVYGIGCRMDNKDAVKKVYLIRNRPAEKSLLVLVSSLEMAKEYVDIGSEVEEKLISKFWPGGLTIIFNSKKDKVLPIVNAGGNTLAVRLPNHQVLQKIIEGVGVPLVAPSANFSGGDTPFTFSDVDPHLMQKVDFVLNGMCTMEGTSTIIDTTVKPWKIVRQGVVEVNVHE
jgi:L-threonylcarbamoyladenylate synthase